MWVDALELVSDYCPELFAEFGGGVVEPGAEGDVPVLAQLRHTSTSERLDPDQHVYRPVDALAPGPLFVELSELVLVVPRLIVGPLVTKSTQRRRMK
ncbi:hypothetical protein [Actinomadura madurae]|uniref:hypothetical protein n=1 Tax=Actinomadura madurae TaxID=1993 RepID=UPI0009420665|nr:hypothetical protein [Actinomadura madurae]